MKKINRSWNIFTKGQPIKLFENVSLCFGLSYCPNDVIWLGEAVISIADSTPFNMGLHVIKLECQSTESSNLAACLMQVPVEWIGWCLPPPRPSDPPNNNSNFKVQWIHQILTTHSPCCANRVSLGILWLKVRQI